MKKIYLTVLFLFAVLTINANEQITDFKIKKFGPLETRVYLKGESKSLDNGYFSIRPLIDYSKNNFLSSGLAFRTQSVYSKVDTAYDSPVDHKDLLNMVALYYGYNIAMAGFITSSVLFLGTMITGAAIVGFSYMTKESQERYYDSYLGMFKYRTIEIQPHIGYRSTGAAILIGSSAFFVMACIFLPIMIYDLVHYKKLKSEILNVINGNGVKIGYKERAVRFKFDLIIS